MPRRSYIAAFLILLGSINSASAQDNWPELVNAADSAISDGDYARAVRDLEAALANAQAQQDAGGIAKVLTLLATASTAQTDHAAADAYLTQAIAAIDGLRTDQQSNLPHMLDERARARIKVGNIAGAIADFERAIIFRETDLGPQHISVADTLDELAELHFNQSDQRAAIVHFTRAAKIRARTLGESHPLVARGHDNLARVHMARGDTVAAAKDLRKALAIRRQAWENRHSDIADTLERLAEVALAEQDTEAAIDLVEEALAIRVDLFGPENEVVTNTERQLADLRKQAEGAAQPTLGAASDPGDDSPIPTAIEDQVAAAIGAQPPASVSYDTELPQAESAEPTAESPVAAPTIAAVEPEPVAPVATGFEVQLSALRSSDAARQEWLRLQKKFPAVLGGHELLLTSVDLTDRGTFYRVRTGPFASSQAANEVCADLTRHEQPCLVIKP